MVGLRQMAEPLLLVWTSKGISQTLWRISCFNRRPCDIFSMGPYPNICLPRCKEQAFSTKLVSPAFFDQTHKSWFWRTGTDLHTVWGLPKHNNPHPQKMLHATILQKWCNRDAIAGSAPWGAWGSVAPYPDYPSPSVKMHVKMDFNDKIDNFKSINIRLL